MKDMGIFNVSVVIIEIKFTYHGIHHFKVYSSVVSVFTVLQLLQLFLELSNSRKRRQPPSKSCSRSAVTLYYTLLTVPSTHMC